MKKEIREQLHGPEAIKSEKATVKWLQQYTQQHNIAFIEGVTYAVHRCAERDDIRLVESLFQQVNSPSTVQRIVNSRESKLEYTPLCRAAYRGSIRLLKFLVAAGSDVNYTNSHGEDLLTTLEQGQNDAINQQPENAIFIRERFNQCHAFIRARRAYLIKKAEAAARPPVRRWVPQRKLRALVAIQRWYRELSRA